MQQPLDGYLNLHGKANEKTSTATFKRGIINAIYPQQGTADVQIVGSHSTVIKGVFFSSGVNPNSVMVGDKCRIDMFSEINPADCVIAYTYGRKMTTSSHGVVTSTGSPTGTSVKINHGLNGVPTNVSFSPQLVIQGASPITNIVSANLDPNKPVDATYIYILVFDNNSSGTTMKATWYASCV